MNNDKHKYSEIHVSLFVPAVWVSDNPNEQDKAAEEFEKFADKLRMLVESIKPYGAEVEITGIDV